MLRYARATGDNRRRYGFARRVITSRWPYRFPELQEIILLINGNGVVHLQLKVERHTFDILPEWSGEWDDEMFCKWFIVVADSD